jgi:hypothetical protein
MIEIRGVLMSDAIRFGGRMRKEDAGECYAMGLQPDVVVSDSVALSIEAWVAEKDGVIIAMWGYGQTEDGEAEAWCFTAPEVEQHKKLMLRLNRQFVAHVLRFSPSIICHVFVEYRRAIRWLAWLGFQPADTIQVNGAQFLQMRLRRQ